MQKFQIREIKIDELKRRVNQEKPYVLADARDLDSYDSGHIPGAISIPADEVDQLADKYDLSIDVITYCTSYSCPASTLAAKKFIQHGFKNVLDYKGGLEEWEGQGNPVEDNK